MSVTELNASAEQMDMLAAMRLLADLSQTELLPPTVGAHANEGSLHVRVASPRSLWLWADALKVPVSARNVSQFENGSEVHSAWLSDWHGWSLRFYAYVEVDREERKAATVSALLEA